MTSWLRTCTEASETTSPRCGPSGSGASDVSVAVLPVVVELPVVVSGPAVDAPDAELEDDSDVESVDEPDVDWVVVTGSAVVTVVSDVAVVSPGGSCPASADASSTPDVVPTGVLAAGSAVVAVSSVVVAFEVDGLTESALVTPRPDAPRQPDSPTRSTVAIDSVRSVCRPSVCGGFMVVYDRHHHPDRAR